METNVVNKTSEANVSNTVVNNSANKPAEKPAAKRVTVKESETIQLVKDKVNAIKLLLIQVNKNIDSVNTAGKVNVSPIELKKKTDLEKEKANLEKDLRYFENRLKELLGESKKSASPTLSVTAKDSDVKKAFVEGCKKLAYNVKITKKMEKRDISRMLSDYEEKHKSVSFGDKEILTDKVYKLLQLDKEKLIKIIRYHSLQVDGVFAKKVILLKKDFQNPDKDENNEKKYIDSLLSGKVIKPKGFRVSIIPVDFGEKAIKVVDRNNEKGYVLSGYVKADDDFSNLKVLLILLDYIKAGLPEIDDLPTTKTV